MDILAGTPVTLWVDFLTSLDELVVPEAGTVLYTLHDGTGVRILGPVQLTPEPDATGVSIQLQAETNALVSSRLFDQRTVVLSWMSGGRSGSRRATYRIVPFPLYTAGPDTVRDVIGIASDELPDTAIDLFTGYLFAAGKLGTAGRVALDQALVSGGSETLVANRLVVYATIEQMLPALPQRILQAKTDGTLKSERIKGLDLEAFAGRIQTQLGLDTQRLLGTTVDQLPTPVLMVLTAPGTDPVTSNAPDTGA